MESLPFRLTAGAAGFSNDALRFGVPDADTRDVAAARAVAPRVIAGELFVSVDGGGDAPAVDDRRAAAGGGREVAAVVAMRPT